MTDPQTTLFSLQARSLPLPTLPTLLTLLTYLPVRYPQPIPPSLHHTIIPIYLSIYGVLTYLHTHTHTHTRPSLLFPPLPFHLSIYLSTNPNTQHAHTVDPIRSESFLFGFRLYNAIYIYTAARSNPFPLPGWKYGNTEIRLSLSFGHVAVWVGEVREGGMEGGKWVFC